MRAIAWELCKKSKKFNRVLVASPYHCYMLFLVWICGELWEQIVIINIKLARCKIEHDLVLLII